MIGPAGMWRLLAALLVVRWWAGARAMCVRGAGAVGRLRAAPPINKVAPTGAADPLWRDAQ